MIFESSDEISLPPSTITAHGGRARMYQLLGNGYFIFILYNQI